MCFGCPFRCTLKTFGIDKDENCDTTPCLTWHGMEVARIIYVGLMWSCYLNWTPTYEWYIARLVVENGHHEDSMS